MSKALRVRLVSVTAALLMIGFGSASSSLAQSTVENAQRLGMARAAIEPQPDGLYVCEAEEFRTKGQNGGWIAKRFGQNYYAATFANSFLSRRAFLGADSQCDSSIASQVVKVSKPGRFLVLVRYEAAYRFETRFRVQIEQAGKQVFNKLYGARENVKVWAFGQKLKREVGWSWGAVENIVWEGHDAWVNLEAGQATIRLVADKQPEPAAKRNIDLIMLTTDQKQIQQRIENEKYLPLDGMLTQSGDVFLRVTNRGTRPLTFSGRKTVGGGNWQQHSPYWVHQRNWPKPKIQVEPGKRSDWVEVGGTMDSLNHGQWFWNGNEPYVAEFAVKNAMGKLESIGSFMGKGELALAADCDTRYSKRLRRLDQVLFDLLDDLQKASPTWHGKTPVQTPIFAYTFTPLDQGRHAAAVTKFKKLFGLSDTTDVSRPGRGMIDVRSIPTPKLVERCQKLGPNANHIAVVSLGDEISLPAPRGPDLAKQFQAFLISRKLAPSDIVPTAKDWSEIQYSIDPSKKETHPGIFYWSKRFQYHFGIQSIKQRTDILRKHLPNAAVGANYSPHYPQEHLFLGEVFKWVSVFRESGMTLPWSEDYIWQVPVGTPQMNSINLDLFRAGIRNHPDRKIMYYVMPHMPNNTPRQWRRLFYSSLAHGMKMINLFEFRPVQVAYTENHVDEPEMYHMILRSFRELGTFEKFIQDGQVQEAKTALWFSETGDIWGDNHGSFAAAKRALYTAIRHQQLPLDMLVEADTESDVLSRYQVLYLTDAHVSKSASKKIDAWVRSGGSLFATAGAGMFDENNQPNTVLRKLLGVEQTKLESPQDRQITWIKQDLPFARPLESVQLHDSPKVLPVFGIRSHFRMTNGKLLGSFSDGTPAVVQQNVGKGRTLYCGFLPSLSYYHPAIPQRPVDRGATDDSMIHFLPTAFHSSAAELIASAANQVQVPVQCSSPLVETTVIESRHGLVIPVIAWTHQPAGKVQLAIHRKLLGDQVKKGKLQLASGKPLAFTEENGQVILSFNLEVADAVIIRK